MNTKHRILIALDGIVDLALGAMLLFFPVGLINVLGLPETSTFFYTNILGAVLFGIGIALFLEIFSTSANVRGLGLSGAIVINLCGGGALLFWLIAMPIEIPLRGQVTLWVVAVLVVVIGLVEFVSEFWKSERIE